MKSKFNPREVLIKAMEVRVGEVPLLEVLNGEDSYERLKMCSFAITQLCYVYGERNITTLIDATNSDVSFYKNSNYIYTITEEDLKNIVTVDSLSFYLFMCWGNILSTLDKANLKNNKNNTAEQTKFALAI